MRTRFATGLVLCALLVVATGSPRALGAAYYLDKINLVPDYTQTDTAYGGFPDDQGVLHGGYFCGPTSTSNGVMWWANNGWSNLAPSSGDRKKDQHDVIATVAGDAYMDAYDEDGVNPTRLANGLSKYIHDCGYEYSRFEWQGWRSTPSWVDTGIDIPNLDWMRQGIEGTGTIQLWSVGWYNYNAATDEYSRDGGHWVSMVGYGHNGTTYDPNYFVIHDPAPRCGTGFANNYVLPTPLASGHLKDSSVSLAGQYKLTGWPINPVGTLAILDGVFVVDLIPGNLAPVAVNDAYAGDEDLAIVIEAGVGVLVNDTDGDGDPLKSYVLSNPSNGTVSLDAAGAFVYTPAANYHGTDSFTYRAFDDTAYSNAAIVTLSIASVNDAPIAVDDVYEAIEGSRLIVATRNGPLVNDVDIDDLDGNLADSGEYTVSLESGPAHGALLISGGGSFKYTPTPGFRGADSFTYKTYDGMAYSDVATVLIQVLSAIQIPGDANRDGVIEAADARILADNWGKAVSGGARMGDFDADGMVGAADASILAANWGRVAEGVAAVPEPGLLGLLVSSFLALASARRRFSK